MLVTFYKSFILTKWYVNKVWNIVISATQRGFILTKWYVIFDICTLFKLKGIGFILTKWYLNWLFY